MTSSHKLVVPTSQGDVVIDPIGTRVGIKISGGADSAILSYLLGLYKRDVRDIKLIPITVISSIKPWQDVYAKAVIRFIEENLGIQFEPHVIPEEHADPSDYEELQRRTTRRLYKEGLIDCHFNGVNLNPDIDLDPAGRFNRNKDRDPEVERKSEVYGKHGDNFTPFANINKKGIAELYQRYDLMDSLFPITKSCENRASRYLDIHCEIGCWWCLERMWGFGRVD
ncbi:hypothetical protein UFOVP247_207 [uncultured Caudovirales phage]|uniref:Uncharacterized protein n=1 Tax=uncultured Caudovirales phage TaxID=2100421 RepID=A0A6J7WUD5_9CAUD|nr:hypothetical protein UFOVP247_207 [uncultured Caudovirales phage]